MTNTTPKSGLTNLSKEAKLQTILSTVRFVFVIGSMFVFLHLNASNFDSTEVKSIFGVALMAALGEGVTGYFRSTK